MLRLTSRVRRLALVPALLLAAACEEGAGVPGAVVVGKPAPAFAATPLEGGPASLQALRGTPVLLNVWATWCHPCRDEIPALEKLHREFSGAGLRVVGVSIDQGGQDAAIRGFLKDFNATYPVWLDPEGEITVTYATMGVPNTFLIGRDGTLLWKHVGPVKETDPALRALIQKELAAGR
ncbi:TlpA family protein disulfide reductase [Longimicrobium terrae]|uniref:DsbE subfamily thiol:disulfide oxidoreductase n=1 Tax=Longimicrobium terrae TaxID=1639882 RepID=A0A841H211_9BACT|nr:TlpA disulfide reductase family protein [Longimicrobium terrae]MBB4637928.1 DsbE subfamily thiol:disulfide oxidoreductase [Longimicrobium terrae]MBB6072175.1 DsbE subfamily thiol:disulfide oxidoreductase [Longimicrobium terrae]NNC28399.1 TlpA family protein disulfide reductase [Longimicrobium terrae]